MLLIALVYSCSRKEKDTLFSEDVCVIFNEDPLEKDVSYEPTISEVEKVELVFREYLKKSKSDSINYPIAQKQIPAIGSLKYYKRRYFGRENIEGEIVIKVEYIFNRCMSPQERERERESWKKVNYRSKVHPSCIFSFQCNMERMKVHGL